MVKGNKLLRLINGEINLVEADFAFVCSRCNRAACWHGESFCSGFKECEGKLMPRSTLRKLGLEDPENYSDAKLKAFYGYK